MGEGGLGGGGLLLKKKIVFSAFVYYMHATPYPFSTLTTMTASSKCSNFIAEASKYLGEAFLSSWYCLHVGCLK